MADPTPPREEQLYERVVAILDEARSRVARSVKTAKTIGIVLCSEKNDAMVKITLPEDNEQIVATRYQLYLPTEEELRAELAREREEAERVLGLAGSDHESGDGSA